jgi:hypothetical protein
VRCNVFRVRNFADLGIKAAPPSFVDSKIKVAGQDEIGDEGISGYLSGVSVPTIATRLSTVLAKELTIK